MAGARAVTITGTNCANVTFCGLPSCGFRSRPRSGRERPVALVGDNGVDADAVDGDTEPRGLRLLTHKDRANNAIVNMTRVHTTGFYAYTGDDKSEGQMEAAPLRPPFRSRGSPAVDSFSSEIAEEAEVDEHRNQSIRCQRIVARGLIAAGHSSFVTAFISTRASVSEALEPDFRS